MVRGQKSYGIGVGCLLLKWRVWINIFGPEKPSGEDEQSASKGEERY